MAAATSNMPSQPISSVTYTSAFGSLQPSAASTTGLGPGLGLHQRSASQATNTSHLMLTGWQEALRERWTERDERERSFDDMINHYQKLAKHAAMLKERNQQLLAAAAAAIGTGAGPTASNSATPPEQGGISPSASGVSAAVAGGAAATALASATVAADAGAGKAVQEAYVKSLESQLSTMRSELADLYKTQSQNAQRLLVLNETLRDREEQSKSADSELNNLKLERDGLVRKGQDLKELLGEKDHTIEMLQDELNTLSLELNQIEARNDDLKRDNASLLQRWLDRMNSEADKMNDANVYLEEVKMKQATISTAEPGTGAAGQLSAQS